MSEPEFIIDTRRHLPHKQLSDCVLFITWRLAFSLPENVLIELASKRSNYLKDMKVLSSKEQQNSEFEYHANQFLYFDEWIGKYTTCKYNLIQEPFNSIITKTLEHDEGMKYITLAYCIMPNHIHLILKPLCKGNGEYYSITEITNPIKSASAHLINKALSIKGQFWQHESYDRVIRDEEECLKTIEYLNMNPVKAGLVDKWEDWKGTYLCEELK